jgi:hypothetical protein
MSPEQKGEIIGRITGEILQGVAGGVVVKGATNLLKGSKLVFGMAQVVSKVPVPKSFPGGKTFEGLLYRGVPREYVNSGWPISPKNILSSHRYSAVGQEALYSSTSTKGVLASLGKESVDDFWRLGKGYGSVTASTESMILRGAVDETGGFAQKETARRHLVGSGRNVDIPAGLERHENQ